MHNSSACYVISLVYAMCLRGDAGGMYWHVSCGNPFWLKKLKTVKKTVNTTQTSHAGLAPNSISHIYSFLYKGAREEGGEKYKKKVK